MKPTLLDIVEHEATLGNQILSFNCYGRAAKRCVTVYLLKNFQARYDYQAQGVGYEQQTKGKYLHCAYVDDKTQSRVQYVDPQDPSMQRGEPDLRYWGYFFLGALFLPIGIVLALYWFAPWLFLLLLKALGPVAAIGWWLKVRRAK